MSDLTSFVESKDGAAFVADAVAWTAANGLQMASDETGIQYVHTPIAVFPSKVRLDHI